MPKRKQSINNLTNLLLQSETYVTSGTLHIIYNNTQRMVRSDIDFFELVYQGEELYLNFSIIGTDSRFDEHINLTTVNNINQIAINPIV